MTNVYIEENDQRHQEQYELDNIESGTKPDTEADFYDSFMPQDGGFGWVVVFAAFCSQFCVRRNS